MISLFSYEAFAMKGFPSSFEGRLRVNTRTRERVEEKRATWRI
jgi:hypothetical protein